MARTNLPSPKRTVRRGVAVCRRLGYDQADALLLIASVARSAGAAVTAMGEYDLAWIKAVHDEAICQLGSLRPKDNQS